MLRDSLPLPNNLNIRPSRPEDAGFLESLYRTTRDDLRRADTDRAFVEALIGMQQRAQTSAYGEMFPNAFYFVIEKLGERIGRVAVDFGHNEVRILDIALIPQARGLGYGTQVLRALQQAAARAGAPLALSVQRSNLRAKQVYAALGFCVEGGDEVFERMIWFPMVGST